MKAAATVLASLLSAASATTLAITWKDCGAKHGKTVDIKPASLPLGTTTKISGTNTLDEAVASGTFDAELKAGGGLIDQHFKGDMCKAKDFDLPLGLGKLSWEGVSCPLKAGTQHITMKVNLASSIPPAMATSDITLKAVDQHSEDLICVKLHLAKAEESDYETEWAEFQAAQGARNGAIPEAFKDNVDKVKEHNSNPDNTYTMSYTGPFADLSAEDFKASMLSGLQPPAEDRVSLGVLEATGADLPDAVDWSEKGAVTPVKNQGSCGSCWAFSTVGSLEGRAQLAKGNLQQFSEQQFVECDRGFGDRGCMGGLMDNAFKYAHQADICTEDSYPYTGKRFGSCAASGCTVGLKAGEVTGHVDVKKNDEQALMEAVSAGPVSVAIDAMGTFQLYMGGIMSGRCGARLDHGVLVVGYGSENGKDYWKVKNSWGSTWGEKGYVRMLRGKGGKGQCGILSGPPSYPVIGGSPVTV